MTRRLAALACLLLLAGGIVWAAAFAAFIHAARATHSAPPPADAIVALTGGADRVETALHYLTEGRAPLLLVSGVGRGLDLSELNRRVALTPDLAARITLGRAATSTVGNADETALWALGHDVRSLVVVTAGYHMPRALLELRRALPGVALYPAPVQPPALRGGMEFATLRILANEFDKYLIVRSGLLRHQPTAQPITEPGTPR